MVTITFTVVDFSIGPSFCTGGNLTESSMSFPGALDSPQFLNDTFAGIFIGGPCNTLTITSQPNILSPFLGGALFGEVDNAQMLWVRTNAYGGINTGLLTNGFNGTPAVAALNNQIPANGVSVPQLAVDFPANSTAFQWPSAACILPTFWGNGTQIPYSYLRTHGPLIIPGTGIWAFLSTIFSRGHPLVPPGALGNWGCKFDAGAFPNDAGNPDNNAAFGTNVPRDNNPDYFGVMAMAIEGTLPGAYTFQLCGQAGVLQHCTILGLNVVNPSNVHQFVYSKTVSFSASGGEQKFKLGIDNPSSFTVYVQATVTAVGSFGDTLTATTSILTLGPGGAVNNLALSFQLTASMIGETFTFSQSMIVGTDPVNLNGTSTVATTARATGTFRVTS